jgi:hypothetical protein
MRMSNVSGGWDGVDGSWGQSEQGPSGETTGGGQTDAMSDVGAKENPLHVDYPQTDVSAKEGPTHIDYPQTDSPGGGQWKKSEPTLPEEPIMMYAILTIPQDEFIAWVSSLPDFVRIRETKIFDQDARNRLGL